MPWKMRKLHVCMETHLDMDVDVVAPPPLFASGFLFSSFSRVGGRWSVAGGIFLDSTTLYFGTIPSFFWDLGFGLMFIGL